MNPLIFVSVLVAAAVAFFVCQYGSIVSAERFLLWAYIKVQKRKARLARYGAQSSADWVKTLETSWLESKTAPASSLDRAVTYRRASGADEVREAL